MSRKILTISMSETMSKWVRERVTSGEYVSLSDYFRQIVRDDQNRRRVFAAELRVLEAQRKKALASLPK